MFSREGDMRTKLLLLLAGLLAVPSFVAAQTGPDSDADAAPGYANNVFHHGQIDSVNLFNGSLTVPINVGPEYPIGPSLKLQLRLTYNSRVRGPGSPSSNVLGSDFIYQPLVGNPALGIGWDLTLVAVKSCRLNTTTWVPCYVGQGQCPRSTFAMNSRFGAVRGKGFVVDVRYSDVSGFLSRLHDPG